MNKLRLSGLAAAIGVSIAATTAQAATRSDLHLQDLGQLHVQYKAIVAKQGVASMAHTRHEQLLAVDAKTFLVMKAANRGNGVTNYRYTQTWLGIPVYGDTIVVSEDAAGNVRRLYGSLVKDIKLPTIVPTLSADQALDKAKNEWLGQDVAAYRLENVKTNLVVYPSARDIAHLAYAVDFFADTAVGTPTRPVVIVDALTGVVLEKRENLQTSEHTGTGPGGNAKVGKYGYGVAETGGVAVYDFLDVTRSSGTCTMQNDRVKTYTMNNTTTTATLVSYACPTAPFRFDEADVNGAYAPINDAHHFGSVAFDMYQSYLGISPLAIQLQQRVHYSTGYDNAFWNGIGMTYGDGAATFYPLVSLDVTAHEISHGFTEQNSGLIYAGQTGGINEAFSDMAGEAAEFFDRGSNDFKVGYDIKKATGANTDSLRYMDDPTRDGASIGNAANYTANMDVHNSSGVYNKAFYRLATTVGWDVPKAFKAFARANRDYWTSGTDFNTGACGVQSAATDLGYAVADVTAAFTAVGVSCASAGAGATQIFDAVPVAGISGATNNSKYYYIDVPAAQGQLVVTTAGGTGDMDLYVKYGGMSSPVDNDYDCRPYLTGNNETCTIPMPRAGRYYILLHGYSAYAGVTLTGDYSVAGAPSITTLTKNTAAAVGTVSSGAYKYYKFTVPAGAVNLTFALTDGPGQSGDADAYISMDPLPTNAIYQFAANAGGNNANELATVNWPQAGDYYIAVHAYNAINGYTVTADYQLDTSAPTILAAATTTPDGNNSWYRLTNATVKYTCNDAGGSYVVDCPTPTVLSTDGASVQSPAWVVHDGLGNASAPSNQVAVKIDKTAPTVAAAASPASPNGTNGWYVSNVTVGYGCFDATSGVASCPVPGSLTSEGSNIQSPAGVTVQDNAGNTSAAATPITVKIDKTAPTIASAASPASPNGANGWYVSNVTVGYGCSDALSGVASCPAANVLTSDGANVQSPAGVTAQDNAGNSSAAANQVSVKIDKTAPVINVVPSREPNENGWYKASVSTKYSCSDATSGLVPASVTACGSNLLLKTEGEGVSSTPKTIQDNAGNSATSGVITVNIDMTRPTIVAETTAEPDGLDGWYTSSPTVHFTCNDNLSGIVACPADVLVTGRGPSVSTPGRSVLDAAGNVSTTATLKLKVDSSVPTLAPALSGPAVLGASLTANANAADAQSGVASSSCGPVDTSTLGYKTVVCTAANGAGLVGNRSLSYKVVAP